MVRGVHKKTRRRGEEYSGGDKWGFGGRADMSGKMMGKLKWT